MDSSGDEKLLKPVRLAPELDGLSRVDAAADAWGEQGAAKVVLRYLAVFGVVLVCFSIDLAIDRSVGSSVPGELRGLAYVLGTLACSALLGPVPTLTCTAVSACVVGGVHGERGIVIRQTLEGLALSIISWRLQAARRRAASANAANLRLERQVLEVGDDERRRIGHDLHDGLGQQLTGIALLTESVAQQIEFGQTPARDELETITRLTTESVSWTKDLARSLSPTVLENEGLLPALEDLATNAAALFDIECVWHFSGPEFEMESTRALHIYRIAQESISNSFKHGKAKRVDLNVVNTNGILKITIVDDGGGLSGKTIRQPGMGLRIMRYRARIVGAEIMVRRAGDEGGTVVECTCPILAG